MDLVVDVFEFSVTLPTTEKYGLTSQMQRSATSIPSNVAEGYGRGTKLDYARFVDMALGSTRELQTQLEICHRLNLGNTIELVERAEEVAKILFGLSRALKK